MFQMFEDGVQVSGSFFSGHRYEGFYSLVAGSRDFPTVEAAKSILDREYMRRGKVEIKDANGNVIETMAARHDIYRQF